MRDGGPFCPSRGSGTPDDRARPSGSSAPVRRLRHCASRRRGRARGGHGAVGLRPRGGRWSPGSGRAVRHAGGSARSGPHRRRDLGAVRRGGGGVRRTGFPRSACGARIRPGGRGDAVVRRRPAAVLADPARPGRRFGRPARHRPVGAAALRRAADTPRCLPAATCSRPWRPASPVSGSSGTTRGSSQPARPWRISNGSGPRSATSGSISTVCPTAHGSPSTTCADTRAGCAASSWNPSCRPTRRWDPT